MGDKPAIANPLLKYKGVGEDHPSYAKLREALARGQDAEANEAIKELEALKNGPPAKAAPPAAARAGIQWWNLLWILILGFALAAAALIYVNRHAQDIAARNPAPDDPAWLPGEALGGDKSQRITYAILKELSRIKPDHCLFAGHQLSKLELVEYLSTLSRLASVKVIIGQDDNGQCQIADLNSPLREYPFTGLYESREVIRTQALIALNRETRSAVAFVGTFPFDVKNASRGEHMLMVLHDYPACERLYEAYCRLASGTR